MDLNQIQVGLKSGDLVLEGSRLYTQKEWAAITEVEKAEEHYDLLQLTKKIQLNSTYGALLSPHFRFGRKELGASVTACGRATTKHMMECIHEHLEGNFKRLKKTTEVEKDGKISHVYTIDSDIVIYGDTDSQIGTAVLRTNFGTMSFVELFHKASHVNVLADGREFAKFIDSLSVWSYSPESNLIIMAPVKEVYRHKVTKKKYTITLANGKKTSVTADHSLMVERDGSLIEIKPIELQDGDIFLTADICCLGRNLEIQQPPRENGIIEVAVERTTVSSIEVSEFIDEYVYDLVMEDSIRPYYFGDDILVHNSCYFRTKANNKDDAIKIADAVALHVNTGWDEFMVKAFNVQPEFLGRMKAGREVVAERGLFQAKKKYILKVVDLEGVTPSGGYKLKSQGSEIKKSDTPKIIQSFLKDLMLRILSGDNYSKVESFVNSQRKALLGKFGDIFAMGVAKQANNLDAYYAAWIRAGKSKTGKVILPGEANGSSVPGQVRAAFHYNEIVPTFEEGAKLIRSGDKVRIFYLKDNSYGWKSIGLPAELENFPDWFSQEFQVDRSLTEEKMFDAKLRGIFNACNWEVPTPQNTLINSILKF